MACYMFVWLTCPDLACSDLSLLLHVWLTWLATCLSGWLGLTEFGWVTPIIILLILLGWPDYTYCVVNTVGLSWLPTVLSILLGCPDYLLCCQCCLVDLIIPTVLLILLGCPDYLLCCQCCWVDLIIPTVLSVLLGCPDYLLCCQYCWIDLTIPTVFSVLLGWPYYTYCFVNTVVLSWLPAVLLILLGSGYSFRYPEGRQWCLRLSSCLEPQGYHLIPLFCLLSRFSAETSCSICLVIFLLMAYRFSWLYFPETIRHVFVKR